jgi:hypothetical protein
MQHPWLKGINWDIMESKLINEEEIPFIPSPGDNFDYLKVNNKINEKDINYNSYLKLINNSTLFNSFYFNSFSPNQRKVLSSNNLSCKQFSDQYESKSKIIHCETSKHSRKDVKKYMNDSINESNCSEYTLSEYADDEDDFIFNRNSEGDQRISEETKNKKFCFSPKKM